MVGALPRKRLLRTRAGCLEYLISGHGRPVWVLFSGAGVALEGWQPLYPGVEALGTVFAWNRPGLGRSERPRAPLDGAAVLAALRELLSFRALAPPYVLVGHSMGGLYAQLFARLYPREVQAVALLEATHPAQACVGRQRQSRLAGVMARMFSLPVAEVAANLQAEAQAQRETARQVARAGAFPPVPLVVISGAQPPPPWLADPRERVRRRQCQRELARLSPLGEQVIARASGHFPQRSQPGRVLSALRALAERIDAQATSPL